MLVVHPQQIALYSRTAATCAAAWAPYPSALLNGIPAIDTATLYHSTTPACTCGVLVASQLLPVPAAMRHSCCYLLCCWHSP